MRLPYSPLRRSESGCALHRIQPSTTTETTMNDATTTSSDMKRTTTSRIAAFALAGALSGLTLTLAAPGGGSLVAARLLHDADAPRAAIARTEVTIEPGTIHVIGIRTQADAAAPRVRG
jgi:hypothetical protein